MLVILEGPDGSGKSHLFKQLVDLGYKTDDYKKHIPSWSMCLSTAIRNPEPNWFKKLITDCKDNKETIILDRSFISELVYRLCDEKCCDVNYNSIAVGNLLWQLKDCKVIYCKTEKAFDNAIERGEDNITIREHHEEIVKAYDICMRFAERWFDANIMRYDWTTQKCDDVIRFINKRG